MFKHTITQQEMLNITVLIKQRKCFLIVQLEIVDLLFGILWTKLQSIAKQPITLEISWIQFYYLNTIDFILEHVLYIFVYFVCFVYLLQVSVYFVETFVKGMIFSCLYGLLIMSSISCCFLCLFVLMYGIGIKFDMMWYDMIWYDK